MATTITGANLPEVARITLNGTADLATKVLIPNYITRCSVAAIANDAKVAFSGTDGSAIGSTYVTVPAGSMLELSMVDGIGESTRIGAIYVASATSSSVVEVVVEG